MAKVQKKVSRRKQSSRLGSAKRQNRPPSKKVTASPKLKAVKSRKITLQGRQRQNATDMAAAAQSFIEFCATVAALRDKKGGCPWDVKQSHATLRRFMIEEAYEAANAMATDDRRALCEELGDVLLQVVLNAQVAFDESNFDIVDVINGINDKMLRRHPHVFGERAAEETLTSDEIKRRWEIIKAQEKKSLAEKNEKKGALAGKVPEREGYYLINKIDKVHPATLRAQEIGKLAHKINFDWHTPLEVMRQLKSEIAELDVEINAGMGKAAVEISAELGDVYFTLAQLCRHLKLDSELVAHDGNEKFLNRFALMEQLMLADGVNPQCGEQKLYEKYWLAAKSVISRPAKANMRHSAKPKAKKSPKTKSTMTKSTRSTASRRSKKSDSWNG